MPPILFMIYRRFVISKFSISVQSYMDLNMSMFDNNNIHLLGLCVLCLQASELFESKVTIKQ